MKKILCLSVLVSSFAVADMVELDDQVMQDTTGQSGVTLSARADFGAGTRISYANTSAQYRGGQHYWLVIDNITGSIEFKNLKIDLVDNFGPTRTTGAIQITLPEEVVFNKFKTSGIYLGNDREVNNTHRFVMGVEIDGTLNFPASSTMNVFAIK